MGTPGQLRGLGKTLPGRDGFEAAEKLRFWVAQRFQRRYKRAQMNKGILTLRWQNSCFPRPVPSPYVSLQKRQGDIPNSAKATVQLLLCKTTAS